MQNAGQSGRRASSDRRDPGTSWTLSRALNLGRTGSLGAEHHVDRGKLRAFGVSLAGLMWPRRRLHARRCWRTWWERGRMPGRDGSGCAVRAASAGGCVWGRLARDPEALS